MRRSVLPALVLALGLTACGSSGDASDDGVGAAGSTPPASSSAAGPGSEDAPLNERGNIPKQLGETVGLYPAPGTGAPPTVTFSVEEIVVDPVCDSDVDLPPVNGHYVTIFMRVEATPEYDPKRLLSFREEDFSVIGPDGATLTSEDSDASTCKGAPDQITNVRIGPGQPYTGWLTFDVPVTAGALVYAPGGEANAWEWAF